MANKKILILGAQGNLGQQLVKVFSTDAEYEVIGWDRTEIDVTDNGLIKKKINDLKPQIIINAVAYNAVDDIESDEGFAIAEKLNVKAVANLAQEALAIGAIMVHYSTDYVFEGNNEAGYKEDDEPKPISRYGESKLMGEQEVIRLSGRGLKWYLIRTSKLFGPKGTSEKVKPSFFDTMLNLSKTQESLDIVNEEVSCFTYTPDLANETKKLLESDKGYGIYHIVNSNPVTWYQAAKKLFKITETKIKVNPVTSDNFPRPAKRPKYSVLLNTKLKKLRRWDGALKEYLETK